MHRLFVVNCLISFYYVSNQLLECSIIANVSLAVSAAHDGKVKERIADYKKIISGIQLPRVVVLNHHQKSQGEYLSIEKN